MKDENELFSILDKVDSSNNYAMAQIQEGMAKHGQAWFAKEQYAGRGQRGKTWESLPGGNIILSIVVQPAKVFNGKPFLLSALVAGSCCELFTAEAGRDIKIKWPNDIYWRDRKTGGILIENIYKGKEWLWAVIGIGMNINQETFDGAQLHAASLKQITGKTYDPAELAKQLHQSLLKEINSVTENSLPGIINFYNEHLYKKNEEVQLKKETAVFRTTVKKVNEYGQLITEDTVLRAFEFGEVSWVR